MWKCGFICHIKWQLVRKRIVHVHVRVGRTIHSNIHVNAGLSVHNHMFSATVFTTGLYQRSEICVFSPAPAGHKNTLSAQSRLNTEPWRTSTGSVISLARNQSIQSYQRREEDCMGGCPLLTTRLTVGFSLRGSLHMLLLLQRITIIKKFLCSWEKS